MPPAPDLTLKLCTHAVKLAGRLNGGFKGNAKPVERASDFRGRLERCVQPLPRRFKATVNDLGMTPSDLHTLARLGPEPEAAELFKRMLVALKVDPKILDMLDPRITHDLKQSCITCGEKRRCRHEVLAGTAVRNMHEYCANALRFNDLFEAVNSRNAEPH